MASPKVSVLLTSYNHAKYLRESIESVLYQTYKDFELIIWDDASTDDSWNIISSYTDERIRGFRNETNQFIEYIRKAISEMAEGEYIAIHHSDDVWEAKKLEKQVAFLDAHPEIGAVFSNALIIGENSELLEDKSHPYYSVFDQPNRNRHEWLNFFFYHGNALCHPSVLIRKECYSECGLYRYGLAQLPDFDMWVRLCFKYDIHILPEKLVRFRVRANEANASANIPDARIRQQFELFQIYNNYRNINSAEEMIKIFPNAEKYLAGQDGDLGFALGMVFLEASKFKPTNLFGLELLFEALNDPERAKKITELYGFTSKDFINLTANNDIFAVDLLHKYFRRLGLGGAFARGLFEYIVNLKEKGKKLNVIFAVFGNDGFTLKFARSLRKKLGRLIFRGINIWRSEGFVTLAGKMAKKLLHNDGYQDWIRKNEPESKDLVKQRENSRDLKYTPLISIIVPVWNTPSEILDQTIGSVVDQTYDNWELCIADGHSNPETENVLSIWAKKDPRIIVIRLDENKGIAVNSNEALLLAKGVFIAFLDHDDLLAPFALFEVVTALQNNPNLDLIYSDEDKTDKSGKRFNPFFKPDFSPDYLRSVNYMPHFLVVRKSLGDQVGWLWEGYDGAQDYDLILRLVEKARVIAHIPKILYHWRAWIGSTAREGVSKPYANDAGKKALQEHLIRLGLPAHVEDGLYPTFYRVHYQLDANPLISIIIPNQDQASVLECCVNSILQNTTYPNFEIFLIENGSRQQETFGLYERLEKDARIHVINWNEPFNYSRINNWAVKQTNGEIVLFLNNDTQVINQDWLEQMLQLAIRQDVGAVGAKLYYPDETIQHAGLIVGVGGVAGNSHKYFPVDHVGYFNRLISVQNVSAVTAACMMIRKKVFQEVDGFDDNYALSFGDVDLCLRILQRGYLNVWTPYAELYHHESKTRGYEDTVDKFERFSKETMYFKHKWTGFLQKGDPYYNPNLTLLAEDFSIATHMINTSVGLMQGISMCQDGS